MEWHLHKAAERQSIPHTLSLPLQGECVSAAMHTLRFMSKVLLLAGAVRSCSPPVKEVAQYVDALNNKSVTFSEFVRTMRRKFCSIAAADAA